MRRGHDRSKVRSRDATPPSPYPASRRSVLGLLGGEKFGQSTEMTIPIRFRKTGGGRQSSRRPCADSSQRTDPSTRAAPFSSSSLMLVIIASVVSISPAIEAAFWRARAGDLGRVDDPGLEHVDVLARVGVEADRAASRLDLVGDDAAVVAAVGGDAADRLLQGPQDDRGAELLVAGERRRQPSRRPGSRGAGPCRRRGRSPPRPPRGWRAGRPRRGPWSPSSRPRSRRRR